MKNQEIKSKITKAKESFLFDAIKSVMKKRNTFELSQDVLNEAYQQVIIFFQDQENMYNLKLAIKSQLK